MGLLILTFVASAVLCGAYLQLARRLQILDRPNERSSHRHPTPHGGGTPLMLALALGFALAPLWFGAWEEGYVTLLLLGLALCLLGVLDDLVNLPMVLRLLLYAAACVAAAWLLVPGEPAGWPGLALLAGASLALLWMLNLYNFMDGIDGIAAIQCFLAASGAALLSWLHCGGGDYALFCLLFAASHLGFLVWNWPPARLFMGDAGSVPTGFLLGALALAGAVGDLLPLGCWLILLALFITDASWTLIWRVVTGQPFLQAHRSHAYQRLAAHWGSHLPVDFVLIAVNGLWLFPLAWGIVLWPRWETILVILAYLPLLVAMAILRKLA